MKLEDLNLQALLSSSPEDGSIHFAGSRALILDALALGLLRRELVDTLGWAGAKAVLSRFGYAHGWQTAATMKDALPWEERDDWRKAGAELHRIQGMVSPRIEPWTGPEPEPFAHSTWQHSYEAEQHLAHLGTATEPVCWTLTGFASGYLSYVNGTRVDGIEVACRACGDETCRFVAKPRPQWQGADLSEIQLRYDQDGLHASLTSAGKALRGLQQQLTEHRLLLGSDLEVEAPPDLVAHSPRMHEVLRVARRVGAVQTTVLITGESGVGKERIARLVHESSPRPVDRFVAVNCGALDDNLLGSELFGHNKGGFTGAGADREGLFEAANGGTLFLDEIGEVTPAMQVKLLRVLQEGQFRRMGDTALRTTDARIVAATNRDLAAEVEAGRFRRDLYYRLRVVEIHVPPLRERPGDILAIARYLLASTAERLDRKDLRGMTPATVKALIAYRWPGNVRELQNAIERAVVLAEGPHLDLQDLPAEVTAPPLASHQSLEAVERQHITAVLESVGGNRERAAKLLGIAPATLYRRLKKWRQS